MNDYLKLLNPDIQGKADKVVYYLLLGLIAILAPPVSLLKRITLLQSILLVYPAIVPKEILIKYRNVYFLTRKWKSDILILNDLSDAWMKHVFTPRPGEVVLDIGAHIGKNSLISAKSVGASGKVVSIEPLKENYDALVRNIGLNHMNNVIPVNAAAYNRSGEAFLYCTDLFATLQPAPDGEAPKVKTATVDSILYGLGITSVDWVKIDTEGAEAEVLEGMREVLDGNPGIKLLIYVKQGNLDKVEHLMKGFDKRPVFSSKYYQINLYAKPARS